MRNGGAAHKNTEAPHHNPEPDNLNLEPYISLFSKSLNDFLEIHAALFHILIHIERRAGR